MGPMSSPPAIVKNFEEAGSLEMDPVGLGPLKSPLENFKTLYATSGEKCKIPLGPGEETIGPVCRRHLPGGDAGTSDHGWKDYVIPPSWDNVVTIEEFDAVDERAKRRARIKLSRIRLIRANKRAGLPGDLSPKYNPENPRLVRRRGEERGGYGQCGWGNGEHQPF